MTFDCGIEGNEVLSADIVLYDRQEISVGEHDLDFREHDVGYLLAMDSYQVLVPGTGTALPVYTFVVETLGLSVKHECMRAC